MTKTKNATSDTLTALEEVLKAEKLILSQARPPKKEFAINKLLFTFCILSFWFCFVYIFARSYLLVFLVEPLVYSTYLSTEPLQNFLMFEYRRPGFTWLMFMTNAMLADAALELHNLALLNDEYIFSQTSHHYEKELLPW